jgi:death on curing protein
MIDLQIFKSNKPRWISPDQCQVLHEMMLQRYGGVVGAQNTAGLEAIVTRAKERFTAGNADLAELAACYAIGIALNRPFASGNAASSFLIAASFLGANGLAFVGRSLPLVGVMLELARGQKTEAQFARYLRCNCDPVTEGEEPSRRDAGSASTSSRT